jgi:hypothetical protein
VKRRDRERHLRDHGARLLREGGNHIFRTSRPGGLDGCATPSRGRDLARNICKDLGIPPPDGPR